ncbi:MAG TPA: Wzz/FepE/Etk N-terminal domain-containing protein [Edaphocola sp.]|nr:Wzz/FepE/Etk N-terminal domain-containing protein [Edaphocola sp.]
MEQNKYDLVAIINTLRQHSKTIWIFTAVALITSVIFVMVRKDVYTAKAEVMVKSFMYFDRNQMFGEEAYYVRDVFARESEVDKAITVLKSDAVKGFILDDLKYAEAKGYSATKAYRALKWNYEIKRTDNSDIEVAFTDTDPELALKGVEAALWKAEEIYMHYFEDFNRDVTAQIEFKQNSLADSLAEINKQIAAVRKEYNLYNALVPVRGATMAQSATLSEANAEGIEKLQTLITIKDKLDQEQAKLTSLKTQYNSFLNENKMHAFYKVSGPYKPTETSNLPAWAVILGSVVAAFIFACFWILVLRAFSTKA